MNLHQAEDKAKCLVCDSQLYFQCCHFMKHTVKRWPSLRVCHSHFKEKPGPGLKEERT